MRCTQGLNENWELVVGYAARTLDPRTRASFEVHLKSCQACSETVAVQQAVWDALDEAPAMPVSRDFDRRLQSRIARQEQSGWWPRKFSDQIWHAAVPVAAACVVFAVSFWLNHPQRMQVVTPTPSQVQDSQQVLLQQPPPEEIDKLEHALDDMDMLGKLSAGTASEKAGKASPI